MNNLFAKLLIISFLLIPHMARAYKISYKSLVNNIDCQFEADNNDDNSQDTLKILCVGNSYTSDEMSYLPYVFEKLCPDMIVKIGHLMSGSASVSEWWVQRDSATIIGTPIYSTGPRHRYNPEGGFLWTGTRYVEWTSETGRWSDVIENAVTLTDALISDSWNYVTFQQVSELVHDFTSISTPLNNLVSLVREKAPIAKVGWLFTHVWNDLYASQKNAINSDSCWSVAKEVVKQLVDSNYVDFMIPNGTAIQNLRHTECNSLGTYFNSEYPNPGLSADGSHLHEGLGCLCASMCAAATLTNKVPEVYIEYSENWNVYGANFYDSDNPVPIGMTLEYESLAYTYAMAALMSPFEITENNEEIIFGDLNGDYTVDIDDVNAVLNIILKINSEDDFVGISDLNGDGTIDVDDLNMVINIILTQDNQK